MKNLLTLMKTLMRLKEGALFNMLNGKIIILCHGTWGQNLVDDVKKSFGVSTIIEVLSLTSNKALEFYLREVEEAVSKSSGNCLIISDLFGGSTANVAIKVGINFGISAITGLSLQTILIADDEFKKSITLDDLGKRIVERNNNLCVDLIEKFKNI